jgi:hypothetical protein
MRTPASVGDLNRRSATADPSDQMNLYLRQDGCLVTPTMSRSSHNKRINTFQILTRTYEDRQVRTKTEQNGIYRQVSAKSVVAQYVSIRRSFPPEAQRSI